MNAVQLDLFNTFEPAAAPPVPAAPILNGMYYEQSSDKFVSFSRGVRYYEESAKGCGHLKEWQNRMKKERAI